MVTIVACVSKIVSIKNPRIDSLNRNVMKLYFNPLLLRSGVLIVAHHDSHAAVIDDDITNQKSLAVARLFWFVAVI